MTSTLPTDLLLARRELALEKKRLEVKKANEIFFFVPHEKQKLFFSNASFHHRYARTGNRFGKSEMGAAEDIAFALGYRPWIAEGDPLRTLGIPTHPTKGLIVTTDWDKTKEVFTELEGEQKGKLIKYIPKDCLGDMTRNHSGKIDLIKVKHKSGGWSTIALDTVVSYKQNPLGQESSSWDWIHIDEPIPQGMWKAMARGLVDRGGRAWFTCTPLSEPWIDAKFIPDADDQMRDDLVGLGDTEKSTWWMMGKMDDNPHNKPEDIERFMQDLSDDEREARRNGIPLAYAGIVYKEFQPNVHKLPGPPPGWTSWDHPPSNYCIRYAIDYHFRKNDAVLFLATSPQGITYVYAELWQPMLLEEEVREIRRVLNGHVPLPGYVDPLASTPNKLTETTAMDEYRRLGLAVMPATKDPVNGIRAVKANLKARDKHGNPVLVFNPALKRTLFEISRGFIWDGDQNKPVKENDDMMENLYRLCLQGLQYVEPVKDSDYTESGYTDFNSDFIALPAWDERESVELRARKLAFAKRYRSN